MSEFPRRQTEPPRQQAWLACAFPVLAWVSQILIAQLWGGAPALFYLLAAAAQALLILAGLVLGVWALVYRGRGGLEVILPAAAGLVLSVGTLLLIALMIVVTALR